MSMLINPYQFAAQQDQSLKYSRSFSTVGHNGLMNAIGTNGSSISYVNPSLDASGIQLDYPLWINASPAYGASYLPQNTLNQSGYTNYYHSAVSTPSWIEYDFGNANSVVVDHYAFRGRSNTIEFDTIILTGSNDGVNWTVIDQTTGLTTSSGWFDKAVPTSGPWRFLRMTGQGYFTIIGEVEFYGSFYHDDELAEGSLERLFVRGDYRDLHSMIGTKDRTDAWQYPDDVSRDIPVVLTASGESSSRRNAVVRSTAAEFLSSNTPGSWWQVDVGAAHLVRLDGYALQTRTTSSNLRNWKAQGSLNGTDWTDLDSQAGNAALSASGSWFSSAIPSNDTWRYFRVISTGVTSSGDNYMRFCYVGIYGQVSPV